VSPPIADIGSFFDAVGKFFDQLAGLKWGSLLLGLLFFHIYIACRTRAYFNALRAAYPDSPIQWRRIWGAYVATYGVNSFIPFRGGEVIKAYLTKTSVPGSSYPAITSSFLCEHAFDACMAVITLTFAFTQGVFPKPPDFSKLGAFDLSYLAAHPRFTLFIITAIGVLVLVGIALLSARVKAFWARVKQGFAILRDRRRWLREMAAIQAAGAIFRLAGFWFLLEAFHVGGSVRNVLLVQAVNTIATALPLTPGGAGVQQALLVKVFVGGASATTVAAYSVGQEIAIAATSILIGFIALATIFRFRSFKAVIREGREAHAADRAAARGAA
jgi:uncharacterized membrane protein YbhN (UPF0104 family)